MTYRCCSCDCCGCRPSVHHQHRRRHTVQTWYQRDSGGYYQQKPAAGEGGCVHDAIVVGQYNHRLCGNKFKVKGKRNGQNDSQQISIHSTIGRLWCGHVVLVVETNKNKQKFRTTRMEWHRGHKLMETSETANDCIRIELTVFFFVGRWLVFFFQAFGVRMKIDARCSMLFTVDRVCISFSYFVFWLFEGPVTAYGGTHRSASLFAACIARVARVGI